MEIWPSIKNKWESRNIYVFARWIPYGLVQVGGCGRVAAEDPETKASLTELLSPCLEVLMRSYSLEAERQEKLPLEDLMPGEEIHFSILTMGLP